MGDLVADIVRLGLLLTLIAFGLWVGGAAVAAWVGREKGRDPLAWFVLAFLLSPVVALIALGAVPTRRAARAGRPVAESADDPAVEAARLMNGVRQDNRWAEGYRWDVATSAETTTRRPW